MLRRHQSEKCNGGHHVLLVSYFNLVILGSIIYGRHRAFVNRGRLTRVGNFYRYTVYFIMISLGYLCMLGVRAGGIIVGCYVLSRVKVRTLPG